MGMIIIRFFPLSPIQGLPISFLVRRIFMKIFSHTVPIPLTEFEV